MSNVNCRTNMLKIKLKRIGRKNDPHYRAVITPQNQPKKIIEYLGHYDPITKNNAFKKERIAHWIKQGAKVSDTLWNLLVKNKAVEGVKRKLKISLKTKGKTGEIQSQESGKPKEKKEAAS